MQSSRCKSNMVRVVKQIAAVAKSMLAVLFFASTLLVVLSGCSDDYAKAVTKEEMWEWLGRHLQQEMPIDDATAVMEKAGFACQSFSNKSVRLADPKNKMTQRVCDHVHCERLDGSPPILVRWEITLVRENDLLKFIGLRRALVYPNASK